MLKTHTHTHTQEDLASQKLMVGERKSSCPWNLRTTTGGHFTVAGARQREVRRSGGLVTRSLCLHTEDKDVMPEELLRLVKEPGLFLCLLSW